MKTADRECVVQKQSQCQEHWISHPENFDGKEDISVEKNIFYHNRVLVSQPRQSAVEVVKSRKNANHVAKMLSLILGSTWSFI